MQVHIILNALLSPYMNGVGAMEPSQRASEDTSRATLGRPDKLQ
jgi:hypothetical protein